MITYHTGSNIHFNEVNSAAKLNILGVPGSVLGPLLFLLYINDIGTPDLLNRLSCIYLMMIRVIRLNYLMIQ